MIYGSITNCSVVGHGVRPEWECRLGYQVISEDTATNTRKVLLQLEARSVNREYYATGYLLTPTIDGQPLNPIGMNFSQANTNIWQVLGNRIITLVGAFNGEKYGSFTTNLTSNWGLKSGSASVYIALDNLHTPPQITGVLIQETNELLNNATDIVQFLSVKNYKFETTTFDDAKISSYQVYHNGVLIGSSTENDLTIDYDSVGTLATFEMDNKIFAMLRFVVIDSYKTSSFIEIPHEVTPYVKPNLVKTSSSIKRNGQLSGKVKMTLVGSFFNQAINGVVNNIDLKFKYWKKGTTEPTEYNDIPYETTDNNISIYGWGIKIGNKEIDDVSSKSAYTFKIKATDHFNKISEIELLCPVGEYLWAEFKDRVDFKEITIQGVNPFKYVEEEVIIGTWFDKTHYRKIVDFGYLPNNGLKEVPHGISNLDYVSDMYCVATNGTSRIPLSRAHTGAGLNVVFEMDDTNVIIYDMYDFSSFYTYVVIEYTKVE